MVNSNIEAQKYINDHLVVRTKSLLHACKYANWHTYCDCLNTMVGCNVRKKYFSKYQELKKVCRWDSFSVIGAPISFKEKVKGFLYFLSPYIASKIINHFRVRKFTIEEN